MKALLVLFLLTVICLSVFPDSSNIIIIAPYAGPVTNKYILEDYDIDSKDTGVMGGLYAQWIKPDLFQMNTFMYFSPEVNYSKLIGLHYNFDLYLLKSRIGSIVIGTGIEYIRINMDAGDNFNTDDFELENNIFANYYRAGYRFNIGLPKVKLSIFPWAGIQYDIVRGENSITIDVNGPSPPPPNTIINDIENTELYGAAGINLKTSISHFIDIEGKYRITFNRDDFFNIVSALANFYFTHFMGLTYRFKFSQLSEGTEMYNLFGVVFIISAAE